MYQLVITADDLGYGIQRDNGIMQCYKSGAVTQGTVLINGSSAKFAIMHAKQLAMPLGKFFLSIMNIYNNNICMVHRYQTYYLCVRSLTFPTSTIF